VAFDAFRAKESGRARRQRRAAFVLVAIFHGVLITAGVVYSYWHVDELTPPTLRVTFMSAAPPPPPPPPPPAGGGGARPKKVAIKAKPEPIPEKPPEIVQPPEKVKPKKYEFRKHDDEDPEEDDAKSVAAGKGKGSIDDGEEDGEEGGVKGGVKGGKVGGISGGTTDGTGLAPAPPRMMPPQFGALQKTSGEDPDFPPSLNHGGLSYIVEATICVSVTGSVDSVRITKGSDPLLNAAVTKRVAADWRFRPMRSGGLAAPFCYPAKFVFNSHL
jgi:protein TonB